MKNILNNKKILITGGTGSFGSSVLEKILKYNIEEIRIFSRDEKKQDDIRRKYNDDRLKFYIGDVRDYESIMNAVRGVDFILEEHRKRKGIAIPFCRLLSARRHFGKSNAKTSASAFWCIWDNSDRW